MRTAIFALTFAIACAGEDAESELTTLHKNSDRGHLQPSAFADLPASIRSDLEQRGCTVPQSYPDSTPHNVVRGRFTSPKEVDVAVLCARD
ncbi:MAG TPA: hypothetical protein VF128_06685, partial [Gemmatimonadaceae bacterium]